MPIIDPITRDYSEMERKVAACCRDRMKRDFGLGAVTVKQELGGAVDVEVGGRGEFQFLAWL